MFEIPHPHSSFLMHINSQWEVLAWVGMKVPLVKPWKSHLAAREIGFTCHIHHINFFLIEKNHHINLLLLFYKFSNSKKLYSLRTHVPTFSWYETNALKARLQNQNPPFGPRKIQVKLVFVAKGERDTFDNFLN